MTHSPKSGMSNPLHLNPWFLVTFLQANQNHTSLHSLTETLHFTGTNVCARRVCTRHRSLFQQTNCESEYVLTPQEYMYWATAAAKAVLFHLSCKSGLGNTIFIFKWQMQKSQKCNTCNQLKGKNDNTVNKCAWHVNSRQFWAAFVYPKSRLPQRIM